MADQTLEIVVAQWVRMKCLFGCDSYDQETNRFAFLMVE